MRKFAKPRANQIKHGLGGTPTYRTWYSMLERCRNPKNASFRYYGARGIRVCDRWQSVVSFVEDMGLRPSGMSLDRLDNDCDYAPENCRWATELDQQRSRRNVKCSYEIAEQIRSGAFDGMTHKEIAAQFGFNQSTVSRIKSGEAWSGAQ